MTPRLGLDRAIADEFVAWKGQKVAVLCNQAIVASDYRHLLDHMLPYHQRGELTIQCVFGPQHGIWGHTQDNMIEWEGYRDPRSGLLFHSLYGEHREPTPAMLEGVQHLIIDIPDVGSRYYTFIWTMALCMKACAALEIPVTVLDRPNPINGDTKEGPVLDPAFASFVGLHPLEIRHGLTAGEIAVKMKKEHYPDCHLTVVGVEGWDRSLYLDETDFPWVMPSPNMPTVETAVVYPGMCLIEGTQVSEGRGTTRPFEIFGAPYIDGYQLATELNSRGLPGVLFRPIQYQPTFHKFRGEICEGAFIHVTDRREFKPFLTACSILQSIIGQWPDDFRWLDPPYEYEYNLMPIDILLGNGWLRPIIESGGDLREALS